MTADRSWAASALLALGACQYAPIFDGNDFSSDPPPPGPLSGSLMICDTGDDTLSAVDPVAHQKRWRIPIGFIPVELEGPHDVQADPGGKWIYVTLSELVPNSGSGPHGAHGTGTIPGFLLKLSSLDGSLDSFAQLEPNPAEIAVSPDGATIYVTHFDLLRWVQAATAGDITQGYSDLAVVDAASMSVRQFVPLCPAAHGVEITPDGRTVYASCATDEIAVVDVSSPTYPVQRVPLVAGSVEGAGCNECPYRLGVAPDGRVWVASLGPGSGAQGQGTFRVYDPALNAFDPAAAVFLCGRGTAVDFISSPGGYRAVGVEQGPCGSWVRYFQAEDAGVAPAPLQTLALPSSDCLGANDISISEDGSRGYLVCEGDHVGPGTVVFLDADAGVELASTPVGVFPLEEGLVP